MAERAGERMSEAAFLAFTEGREERWELEDGVPRMMAGAGRAHDRVVVNVLRLLATQLRGGPCEPFSGDMFIRIPGGNYRMPDAGVECGTPAGADRAAQEPRLVVEVLSPSTRAIDLFGKAEEYRLVPSIGHILLIEAEMARVTLRSRERGWADLVWSSLGDVVEVAGLGVSLPLAEIYERVELPNRPRLVG